MAAYLRNAMLVPEDITPAQQQVYQYSYNPGLRWAGYADGTNINGSVGNLVAYPSPIPHVLDATLRPRQYQLTSDDVLLALQQQAQSNIAQILNSAPRSTGTARGSAAGTTTPTAASSGQPQAAEGTPAATPAASPDTPAAAPPATPGVPLVSLEDAVNAANDPELAASLVGLSTPDTPQTEPAAATTLHGQWEEVEKPGFWSDPWGYIKRTLAEGAGITPVQLSPGQPSEPVPLNGTIPAPQNLPDPQELSRRYGTTAGIQPSVPTQAQAMQDYLQDYAKLPVLQSQPVAAPALTQAMQLTIPSTPAQSAPAQSAPAQSAQPAAATRVVSLEDAVNAANDPELAASLVGLSTPVQPVTATPAPTPEVIDPRSFIQRYVDSDPILKRMLTQGRDFAAAIPVERRRELGNALLNNFAKLMGGEPSLPAVTSMQPAGSGGVMLYPPVPSAPVTSQPMAVPMQLPTVLNTPQAAVTLPAM